MVDRDNDDGGGYGIMIRIMVDRDGCGYKHKWWVASREYGIIRARSHLYRMGWGISHI